MHAVAGDGEHGAGGGIGRKRRIGWPSIVSLGLEVSDLFGSQRSRTASPHNLRTPTPCPCTSLWGKWDFAKLASRKLVGPPPCPGQGPCGCGSLGPVGFQRILRENGLRARVGLPFLRGCPPRDMRAPPGRCPPCPTLSQSKRRAASSCTRLCRPRGRPAARPTCGVHAVRCLGSLFLGETGGFPAK